MQKVLLSCASSLVISAQAWSQGPAYSVRVLPSVPNAAGYHSPGFLPDGRIVINAYWPLADGSYRSHAFIEAGEGYTTVADLDGEPIMFTHVQTIGADGAMYGSRVNDFGVTNVRWDSAGVPQRQSDIWNNPVLTVIDASANGRLLAYADSWAGESVVISDGALTILEGTAYTGNGWGMASAMNRLGDAAGLQYRNGLLTAFVWSDAGNRTLSLPALPGQLVSQGLGNVDINDLGWVVLSQSITTTEGVSNGILLWRNDAYESILSDEPLGNVTIDNLGSILYTNNNQQLLWRDGTSYSLDELELANFNGSLTTIDSLLIDGRAVGSVSVNGVRVPVLLTPIPSPATGAIFILSLAFARRRR